MIERITDPERIRVVRAFPAEMFTRLFPPADPFVRPDWMGVAFDRNRYETLAPAEWWDALSSSALLFAGDEALFAFPDDARSTASDVVELLPHEVSSVYGYLGREGNFMKDQWIVGRSLRWACLLDQDVSLFGGDAAFMAKCFETAGGRERLLDMMRDDFLDVAPGSEVPNDAYSTQFEGYFRRLLALG